MGNAGLGFHIVDLLCDELYPADGLLHPAGPDPGPPHALDVLPCVSSVSRTSASLALFLGFGRFVVQVHALFLGFGRFEVQVHHLISLGGWDDVISIYLSLPLPSLSVLESSDSRLR
jgi:hypothetical protein